MKIRLVGVPVSDQAKALQFYTEVLLFVKKRDVPVGEDRWLTVVSPEEQDGAELLLEPAPNHFPPAKEYYDALYEAGIPCAQFQVDDIQAEYERLVGLGVEFSMEPTTFGPSIVAVFDDTCGNRVQMIQEL